MTIMPPLDNYEVLGSHGIHEIPQAYLEVYGIFKFYDLQDNPHEYKYLVIDPQ